MELEFGVAWRGVHTAFIRGIMAPIGTQITDGDMTRLNSFAAITGLTGTFHTVPNEPHAIGFSSSTVSSVAEWDDAIPHLWFVVNCAFPGQYHVECIGRDGKTKPYAGPPLSLRCM